MADTCLMLPILAALITSAPVARAAAPYFTGLGDLPGGLFSSGAHGVSADGSVVVGYGSIEVSQTQGAYEACRWENGSITGLGRLPGTVHGGMAWGVSGDGSIIVGATASFPIPLEAFIWDATHGMRSLYDVLINEFDFDLALAGWTLREAMAISQDGTTIVGNGVNSSGDIEAWVAHIPEPSCLGLFTFAVLMGLRRRRPGSTFYMKSGACFH